MLHLRANQGGDPMLRRSLAGLRARLARRFAEEAYWAGWEEGKCEAVHGLAVLIHGGDGRWNA